MFAFFSLEISSRLSSQKLSLRRSTAFLLMKLWIPSCKRTALGACCWSSFRACVRFQSFCVSFSMLREPVYPAMTCGLPRSLHQKQSLPCCRGWCALVKEAVQVVFWLLQVGYGGTVGGCSSNLSKACSPSFCCWLWRHCRWLLQ